MANEEQLEILKSGAEEWNKWRKENRVGIDLSGASLVDAELSAVDLSRANLSGANLEGANLHRAHFLRADLQKANLEGADLSGANFQDANLFGASLQDANLRGANLVFAKLHESDLRRASLVDADLRDAKFVESNLIESDLRGANLGGANLSYSDLSFANLLRTNLGEVYLGRTNLTTSFDEVSGLEWIRHLGPSSISPEVLEWSQGKLPDVFLKGIGFKDWEILNAKLHDPDLRPDEVVDIVYQVASLRTKGPIQVSTLFISYSRLDSAFAELLERRLKDDGIRAWRDVHDMVAGPVQSQIERAINLNGTVLLVLSSNSLGSDWVEWEVQKARDLQKKLEGEGKRDAHVLCPVAIDDTWKDSKWSGPLMNQLLKYNILDFSKWEDAETVETVYAKLKAGIAKYYSDFGDSTDASS